MGVVHKLKPEISDYILKIKGKDSVISCRKLSTLVSEKFQIKLSKSSINALLKTKGLSLPVGRRRKKKRGFADIPGLGAIFLKAADCLFGGSQRISQTIMARLNANDKDISAKTENLIYLDLPGLAQNPEMKQPAPAGPFAQINWTKEQLLTYLKELQQCPGLYSDILGIFTNILQEVRCAGITLAKDSVIFLDGQLHTVWSTPYLPYDFSAPIHSLKEVIDKSLRQENPLLLCMAPGYDLPTKEFFDFLLNLDSQEKRIIHLTLYGNKLENLETSQLEFNQRRYFIFGLWPWQFREYRKVKFMAEFKPYYSQDLGKNFYAAQIELELSQPNLNKIITLKGCALKTSPAENVRLIILSNLPDERNQPEELLNLYLSHWPNLEETFQDYSRKIELFTYTASAQRFFSVDQLSAANQETRDLRGQFEYYLKALDLYCRWHFFPSGYEDRDFPTMMAKFYSLKGRLKKEKGRMVIQFKPPAEYAFLKDLEYACRRVNEREIVCAEGYRLQLRA